MRGIARIVWLAALAVGSLAITRASLSYFALGDLHPFILEKEPLPFERGYITALHVHVVAAALSLPACLALVSRRVLRVFPRAHRWLGRAAGVVVLAALVPSGAWLSFFAQGGAPSTAGFLASGAIVAAATVLGVRAARRGDYAGHRRAMLHVLAQMSVAVTSRALLIAGAAARLDPEPTYIAALWGPVVVSAVAAELVARRFTRPLPRPLGTIPRAPRRTDAPHRVDPVLADARG